MSTTTAPITVEEFLKLPDIEEQRVELIQGEVIDMGTGGPRHEFVKANLNKIFQKWLGEGSAGVLFVESAFYLDDRTCLIPDLSLVSTERLKRGLDTAFRGAPDLAIEVVSSETAIRLRTKIELYLRHGAKLVLVIYPEIRFIEAYSATGQIRKLDQDQVLEDQEALPGFSTPVGAIFEGL